MRTVALTHYVPARPTAPAVLPAAIAAAKVAQAADNAYRVAKRGGNADTIKAARAAYLKHAQTALLKLLDAVNVSRSGMMYDAEQAARNLHQQLNTRRNAVEAESAQ